MNTQKPSRDSALARFARAHPALWQFVKFALLGLIATLVELALFALCSFYLFAPLRDRPFSWWLIRYPVENGGLGAFCAFALSFAVGQAVNFLIQRRYTFRTRSHPLRSALLYALATLLVYAFTLWLPSLLLGPLSALLGPAAGALAVKLINMFSSMLILFPVNKFIVMR